MVPQTMELNSLIVVVHYELKVCCFQGLAIVSTGVATPRDNLTGSAPFVYSHGSDPSF